MSRHPLGLSGCIYGHWWQMCPDCFACPQINYLVNNLYWAFHITILKLDTMENMITWETNCTCTVSKCIWEANDSYHDNGCHSYCHNEFPYNFMFFHNRWHMWRNGDPVWHGNGLPCLSHMPGKSHLLLSGLHKLFSWQGYRNMATQMPENVT